MFGPMRLEKCHYLKVMARIACKHHIGHGRILYRNHHNWGGIILGVHSRLLRCNHWGAQTDRPDALPFYLDCTKCQHPEFRMGIIIYSYFKSMVSLSPFHLITAFTLSFLLEGSSPRFPKFESRTPSFKVTSVPVFIFPESSSIS